jgi:hypothetical protein
MTQSLASQLEPRMRILLRVIIDKWDFIKLRNCTSKDTISRVKKQPVELEEYLCKLFIRQ